MNEKQTRMLKGACEALRENTQKAKNRMSDINGGRCCLRVMEDFARDNSEVPFVQGCDTAPDRNYFKEVYGIEFSHSFKIEEDGEKLEHSLMNLNDGRLTEERSHVEIAEIIEKEFNLK